MIYLIKLNYLCIKKKEKLEGEQLWKTLEILFKK